MVSHKSKSCKKLKVDILEALTRTSRPLSLEQIGSRIDLPAERPFYELFHHVYELVVTGKLELSTKSSSKIKTNVFRARSGSL